MNQISTKLYKLDFKDLINNATNRVYWNKKWTLFQYDGLYVEFILDSIDITNNKLSCKLELQGVDRRDYWSVPFGYMRIPLQDENFNELALTKELVGKVGELFLEQGERDLKLTDEYYNLKELEDDFKDKLEDIAKDFLDSNGVDNKSIREVYIDDYVGRNKKDYTYDYIRLNKPNTYLASRITFALIMDCKDKAEYISMSARDVDTDWIFEQADELREQLENEDLEEFEDNLEDI